MKRNFNFYKIILIIVLFFVPILVLTSPAFANSAWMFQEYHKVQLPADDYVVFHARGFEDRKYVVLDLKQNEVHVYSPYREEGLLSTRLITDAEHDHAIALLTSDQAKKIPESSNKAAFDAFEFSAYGTIRGVILKFQHILPDDLAVLSLYDLYKHFCGELLK